SAAAKPSASAQAVATVLTKVATGIVSGVFAARLRKYSSSPREMMKHNNPKAENAPSKAAADQEKKSCKKVPPEDLRSCWCPIQGVSSSLSSLVQSTRSAAALTAHRTLDFEL